MFYRRHWGKIQSELSFCQQGNPQVIAEAFIYPYLITTLKALIASMRSVNHQTLRLISLAIMSCNQGWTRNETDSKEMKSIVAETLHLKLSKSLPNVARVKGYSRNRIYSKYHDHASAYSLLTVCCRFIYLYEVKRKRSRHRQLEQIARMSGKSDDARSSTANQRISSGRFRGHPI